MFKKTKNFEENELAFGHEDYEFGREDYEFCCRRMSFKLTGNKKQNGSSFPVSLTKRCKKLGERTSHFEIHSPQMPNSLSLKC